MQHSSQKNVTDILHTLIEDCLLEFPTSSLLISLNKQYQQRGFLTKKQMEGLYDKASKATNIQSGKLATLEANIKRMPNRYKSELPKVITPVFEKDEKVGNVIQAILDKYPQHKRVLFLKAKFDNNEVLHGTETDELKKFYQVATKNKAEI